MRLDLDVNGCAMPNSGSMAMASKVLRWLRTDSKETCCLSSERRTLVKSVVNSRFSCLVADAREDSSSSSTGEPVVTEGKADRDSKIFSSDASGLSGGVQNFSSPSECIA